jgi:hypothetical protein
VLILGSVFAEERVSTSVLKPVPELRADVAPLLLSMKLLTFSAHEPIGYTRTELCLGAKHCLLDLETTGVISEVLGAGYLQYASFSVCPSWQCSG